ncbi:hypothetical protein AB0E88_17260 [Streptomyces sp. NPDC028635]|uniref:hypothetical protein n=1 Tax=Streptomyces sp. NPDC028635 TaxID=3154800 RepID=UPI0033D70D0E
MFRRIGSRTAVGVAALLALAGCGSSGDGGHEQPTAAPAADKGPACVGRAPADGLHVLRGGGFRLPGGGGVQYAAADADGTSRTAVLRDGAKYQAGQRQQTVRTGQRIRAAGHAFTVSQICSYRVVLEPTDAKDKAAAVAAPPSMKPAGGEADNGLCFTNNPSVLAAASKGFPPRGQTLSVLRNGGVWSFPTGLSIRVSYIDTDTGVAGFGGVCAALPVAQYKDARVGDPVEFAGVRFTVSELTEKAVRLTRTSA